MIATGIVIITENVRHIGDITSIGVVVVRVAAYLQQ